LWNELAEAGVKPHWAALISPYAAQVRHLRHQVPHGLEVGTVDGFQGREKEVILLSLVRSNDQGEVGFLSDTRRMNVAMTRARRFLMVVGDSATIGRHIDFTKPSSITSKPMANTEAPGNGYPNSRPKNNCVCLATEGDR
jgi:ATP-dependent RNA/DNA helicase IGHMBP2